eukprot:scaffold52547_cov68-Phaeocystis_antarctica.AAC.3
MSVHPSLSRAGVAQGSALGLGATAPSALGWYRPSVEVPETLDVQFSSFAHAHSTSPHIDVLPVLVSTYEPL